MVEIVLNEREWTEQMIAAQSLGTSPTITLGRLARYYYSQGYKKRNIQRMLEEYLVRCNPYVTLSRWADTLAYCARTCDKYPLHEIDHIGITQSELDAIATAETINQRKLLFTLLCLAKYNNMVNPRNNNWVSQDAKVVFPLANITMNSARKNTMINKLWIAGRVTFSQIVDNTNLNVSIVDDEGEEVLQVTDMRNLGNQYMMYCGEPYIECAECGLVIRKANNKHKYCKDCASAVNMQGVITRRLEAIIA